jgi:hypothetical protein
MTRLVWIKSSYSDSSGGDCIEVATDPASVHIRDSKAPKTPHLTIAPPTWVAFLDGVRER